MKIMISKILMNKITSNKIIIKYKKYINNYSNIKNNYNNKLIIYRTIINSYQAFYRMILQMDLQMKHKQYKH